MARQWTRANIIDIIRYVCKTVIVAYNFFFYRDSLLHRFARSSFLRHFVSLIIAHRYDGRRYCCVLFKRLLRDSDLDHRPSTLFENIRVPRRGHSESLTPLVQKPSEKCEFLIVIARPAGRADTVVNKGFDQDSSYQLGT